MPEKESILKNWEFWGVLVFGSGLLLFTVGLAAHWGVVGAQQAREYDEQIAWTIRVGLIAMIVGGLAVSALLYAEIRPTREKVFAWFATGHVQLPIRAPFIHEVVPAPIWQQALPQPVLDEWLAKAIESDRTNLASRLLLQRYDIGVAGLLRQIDPSVIFAVSYLNISVFTMVLDPSSIQGRVRFKGEPLLITPLIEPLESNAPLEAVHAMRLGFLMRIPLSDSAAKAFRDAIDNDEDLTIDLQGVVFVVHAKQDTALAPIRLHLDEKTWRNNLLRGNLFENGAKVIDGKISASAGYA